MIYERCEAVVSTLHLARTSCFATIEEARKYLHNYPTTLGVVEYIHNRLEGVELWAFVEVVVFLRIFVGDCHRPIYVDYTLEEVVVHIGSLQSVLELDDVEYATLTYHLVEEA